MAWKIMEKEKKEEMRKYSEFEEQYVTYEMRPLLKDAVATSMLANQHA